MNTNSESIQTETNDIDDIAACRKEMQLTREGNLQYLDHMSARLQKYMGCM
jgi:hypothetical protein